MTEYLPYVTTKDGRMWSAEAVDAVRHTADAMMAQRDKAQLDLALLKGRIHLLDRENAA